MTHFLRTNIFFTSSKCLSFFIFVRLDSFSNNRDLNISYDLTIEYRNIVEIQDGHFIVILNRMHMIRS